MEKQLSDIYKDAGKGIYKKWDAYMKESGKVIEDAQKAYDLAVKNNVGVKEAKKALEWAKKEQTLNNDQYKSMIRETSQRLANVNQQAAEIVNGNMPSVYSVNYNQGAEIAKDVGVRFGLVDESTVKKLVKDGDIKLPRKKVSIPKDMRWNTKQMNSSVLQGILQGDSMDKIAKRILPIVNNNDKAAIRNARTMVTGAENAGRMDSYHQLEEDGAVLKKVWIASLDDRVRESHEELDGTEVDIDEPFVTMWGNEIMYPGDPDAEPEEVYNCRCSMETKVIGFRRKDGGIEYV